MSIKLEYILKRNKSNLKTFIEKNKLTSYNELVEYCKTRKFIPCTESEYTSVVQIKLEAKNEPKVNREVSETQKPKKRRYRRKKQQDTSKLPDSSDKG